MSLRGGQQVCVCVCVRWDVLKSRCLYPRLNEDQVCTVLQKKEGYSPHTIHIGMKVLVFCLKAFQSTSLEPKWQLKNKNLHLCGFARNTPWTFCTFVFRWDSGKHRATVRRQKLGYIFKKRVSQWNLHSWLESFATLLTGFLPLSLPPAIFSSTLTNLVCCQKTIPQHCNNNAKCCVCFLQRFAHRPKNFILNSSDQSSFFYIFASCSRRMLNWTLLCEMPEVFGYWLKLKQFGGILSWAVSSTFNFRPVTTRVSHLTHTVNSNHGRWTVQKISTWGKHLKIMYITYYLWIQQRYIKQGSNKINDRLVW